MIIALAIPFFSLSLLGAVLAVVDVGCGGRLVTRAKKLMSDFIRGHGRVPAFPIPRRVDSTIVAVAVAVEDAIGVVATIRVSGWVSIGDEGSVRWGLELLVWEESVIVDMLHWSLLVLALWSEIGGG